MGTLGPKYLRNGYLDPGHGWRKRRVLELLAWTREKLEAPRGSVNFH